MTRITRESVRERIERGQGGGVWFLHGAETYLREEAVQAILDAYLDPAARDFNLDQLRGGDVDPETLASVTQTPPMMGDWRVVLVRDAQDLTRSARHRDIVEGLLDRTPPGLVLLLVTDIPERSTAKFYTRLKKDAQAFEFQALSENDVPGWLMERARDEGYDMDVDAARALAAAVGTQLSVLVNEMDKLRELAGGETIRRQHVEEAVGVIVRVDRWAWFDLVADRQLTQARAQLPDLLAAGESGVGLVIGLGSQFLRLMLGALGGKDALESELPPRQRWLARRVLSQVRNWRAVEIQNVLEDLLRADWLLKSGGSDDLAVLDELLLRMRALRPEAA